MKDNRRDFIKGALASVALSGISVSKAFGQDINSQVKLPIKLPLKGGDTLEIKGFSEGRVDAFVLPKSDPTTTTPAIDNIYKLENGGNLILDSGNLDEQQLIDGWITVDFNLHVKSPKSDKVYGPEYQQILNDNTELLIKTNGVQTIMNKPNLLDPAIIDSFEKIHGVK